jgi:hypothetical protein
MFRDDMSLGEARDTLRDLVEDGHECPCCRQFARIYRRSIHASMASALVKLHQAAPVGTWLTIADHLEHRELADAGKLAYWNLIAPDLETRDDGSARTGVWKVTAHGAAFVRGEIEVPRYARVYAQRCLGLVGPYVSIRFCLGKAFDYDELMNGEAA